MSNRTTLTDLATMDETAIAALPVDQIAELMDDFDAEQKRLKAVKARIDGALGRRYGERAGTELAAKDKPFGTVHVQDGGYDIEIVVPKKVTWDQSELGNAVEVIRSWGEDPAEYVTTEIKVSERAYDAWPSPIRKLFEPARTVEPGAPKFKLKKLAEAA